MKKIIKHSKYVTFINDSVSNILTRLDIDSKEVPFSFDDDFYLKEYKNDYKTKLEQSFSTVKSDEIVVCDRVLFEDLKEISDKVTFISDILSKSNINDKIKYDFSDFNIALYNGMYDNSYIKSFFKNAKFINYESMYEENGFRFLSFNKELGYKIASSIVLDAYDSGADFMVVDDSYSFYMFDCIYSELKSFSNRHFDDFYILSFVELVALSLGLKPESLNKHKLKVSLIWKYL